MAIVDGGNNTPGKANVDGQFNLDVNLPGNNADGTERGGGPAQAGAAINFSQNDAGSATGAQLVVSPEVDHDYRYRVMESVLDQETFNYTAQNTGKYNYVNTTMTVTWTSSGMTTNGGSTLNITTGARVRSYGLYPLFTIGMTYLDAIAGFTALIPTNTTIDLGLFTDGGSNPFDPTDGVFFRFDSAGVFGYAVNGGVEATVPLTGFVLELGTYYKFTISTSSKKVEFWIDDILHGTIVRPAGRGQPFLSTAQPFAIRHAITGGAASAVVQCKVATYQVSLSGFGVVSDAAAQGARAWGSHQGLGGGTMGSLANYANNANPTAAAGSNTGAGTFTGLGGQFSMLAAAAGVTDLIVNSYQVPAGTVAVQGRRLAIYGVTIQTTISGAAVAGTDTQLAYSLAFGHTAVSLATTDAATTKGPRREALGFQSWVVGAPIGTPPREPPLTRTFTKPIYVEPGQFVAIAAKFLLGTATASQAILHHITFDYGWE